ncbi:hypothetical protein R5R35_005585 [Gryllus longicercus]|uniref:Charged multivesicular body protein 7 n=2 Tax=Gryllus longicercus TaxID=2509291 RepID=A0AAN9V8F2_9ORTH
MEISPQKGDGQPLPLPELELPKSWWNDDEVSYLFSPFRSHDQNPNDREAKIKFWKPMICKWCDHHKKCTFTLSELEKTFTKNQLIPACLTGVVEDMLRRRQICEKDQFLLLPAQTWSGWAVDMLIKKPMGWSLKKARELLIKSEEEKTYVVLEATKLQAELLLAHVKETNKGLVLTKTEVKKIASGFKDLDVVLHWLLCHNKMVQISHKEDELLKFCGDEEKVTDISERDIGIFALQQTERKLCQNLEELEAERLNAIQSAKTYIAKGMKQMAKSSLRKKQEIEKSLDKRALLLGNVQTMLSRIQESHSDSKILESYQQGVAALKFTLKEANLTDENVSNTMLELNEILDIHDDIQESMAQSIGSSNDKDLEDELEQLLLSDTMPVPSETIDIKELPEVPRGNPSEPIAKAQAS